MSQSKQQVILENWGNLTKRINKLSEEEVKALLAIERANRRRTSFMLRLHGRFNKLRAIRERRKLLGN